jgi:hypothetical protein
MPQSTSRHPWVKSRLGGPNALTYSTVSLTSMLLRVALEYGHT